MNKSFLLTFLILILLFNTVSAFETTPDVNIVSPMSGEQFFLKHIISINMLVQDTDTNTSEITIDLNFSTSQTQGTGTPILESQNLWSALICDSNNLFTPKNCIYVWDTTGVSAGTYFIIAEIKDANSEVDFNAGASSFTLSATEVNINLTNFGGLVNNAGQVVEQITFGVQMQGDLIGLAIGISIAVGLLIALIFSVFAVLPKLIGKVKEIR